MKKDREKEREIMDMASGDEQGRPEIDMVEVEVVWEGRMPWIGASRPSANLCRQRAKGQAAARHFRMQPSGTIQYCSPPLKHAVICCRVPVVVTPSAKLYPARESIYV
jgi:hypothetical protein